MSNRTGPVRVLELRSVRGTGGGPEKTILMGAAIADRTRVHVTVCYLRDRRDGIFAIDARARDAQVDYVEIFERELDGWHTDPSAWPQKRDFKTFQEWFSIDLHSVIEDLMDDVLVDDDLDG